MNTTNEISQRLEYLRGEINHGRISYGEIAELQSLANHIESGDTQLLEWAGVEESDVVHESDVIRNSDGDEVEQ